MSPTFLAIAAALAEDWPPGSVIDPAATVDITKPGFAAVADLIPVLLPESIPLDQVGQASEGWTCLDSYEFSLTNGEVRIQVDGASITPGNGLLDITADLQVSLNDAGNPFSLYTYALCIGDTCSGYVNPFPATIHKTLALEVVDDGAGGKKLDATVGEMELDYSLDHDDIVLNDCAIATVEDILNFFGLSLEDLILDLVGDQLLGALDDFGPEIEQQIEDAFSSATIEQDLDLNGASVHLKLEPSDVEITPAAARIVMAGSMEGAANACVAAYDPGGSKKTLTDPPDPGAAPSGIDSDFHAAISLSDDFTNEALYSLWRGGLLCYTVDADLGFPLDTSILDGISGGAFGELFPGGSPMIIVTRPMNPPTGNFQSGHDVGLDVDALGVDFYAELDGRQARLVGLDLDATIGVDLDLDSTTGNLGIGLDFGGDAIQPSVGYNEIAPGANDAILDGFGGLFDTLVGGMLGGLLDGLSFTLPSISGMGLQRLEFAAAGRQSDWLGGYAWIGPVEYGSGSGCGGCGGTGTDEGSSGCDSSCSGGGCVTAPTGPLGAAGLVLLVLLRRRR